MDNIAQPKARKMAAPAKPQDDEDEGWGDAGALLDWTALSDIKQSHPLFLLFL